MRNAGSCILKLARKFASTTDTSITCREKNACQRYWRLLIWSPLHNLVSICTCLFAVLCLEAGHHELVDILSVANRACLGCARSLDGKEG
jgi:hypothetical protein